MMGLVWCLPEKKGREGKRFAWLAGWLAGRRQVLSGVRSLQGLNLYGMTGKKKQGKHSEGADVSLLIY